MATTRSYTLVTSSDTGKVAIIGIDGDLTTLYAAVNVLEGYFTSDVLNLANTPSIPPSKLDAANSLTDQYLPRYDATTGKFEWVAASGAADTYKVKDDISDTEDYLVNKLKHHQLL